MTTKQFSKYSLLHRLRWATSITKPNQYLCHVARDQLGAEYAYAVQSIIMDRYPDTPRGCSIGIAAFSGKPEENNASGNHQFRQYLRYSLLDWAETVYCGSISVDTTPYNDYDQIAEENNKRISTHALAGQIEMLIGEMNHDWQFLCIELHPLCGSHLKSAILNRVLDQMFYPRAGMIDIKGRALPFTDWGMQHHTATIGYGLRSMVVHYLRSHDDQLVSMDDIQNGWTLK